MEFEAKERTQASSGSAAPVSTGPPRDSRGREYSCTEEVITDQDRLNAHFWIWPGGIDLQPMPKTGTMIQRICRYADATVVDDSLLPPTGYLWVADPVEQTVQDLLAVARQRLVPAQPVVRRWPSDAAVVGIAAWFRVDTFTALSPDPAEAGDVKVWARAVPSRAVWQFDDEKETCQTAGRAYGDSASTEKPCTHVFHRSTDGRRTGTVKVHYDVSWWSTIDPTPQPLPGIESPTFTFEYQVREIEAVIR